MNPASLASHSLHFTGWTFEGEAPRVKKYVCIAYPHTSNWDGLVMIAIATSLRLDARWMIKDTWTKGPLGAAMRHLGAMAIDRSSSHGVVAQMIEEFRLRDRFVLGIPPEGTRGRADYWKSGFYHIAVGAGVPVVPGYIDFDRRRVGLGPPITMTGEVRADMDRIRDFYASKKLRAYDPANVGPIRLREESA